MINSSLCYIEKDGKYLMLHRVKKKGDVNRDKWIGIGGKFLEDESPYDCVMREAKEETGLDLADPEYRGIVTFVSDRYESEQMHLFLCRRFSGEVGECDEGALEWVGKTRLTELNLWRGDMIFLGLLDRDVPFFSLKLRYRGEELEEAVLDGSPLDIK